MYLPLFVGDLCLLLVGMHYFMSILSFAIILTRKAERVALLLVYMYLDVLLL